MARIFQTGFEMGHLGPFDLTIPPSSSVDGSITRGVWSAYSSGSINTGIASISGNQSEIYMGLGLYRSGNYGLGEKFLGFRDGGTNQVTVECDASNHYVVKQGNGTTLGTGTIIPPDNSWSYLELHLVISDASGVVETKVNGVSDITASSLDTKNTANAFIDRFFLLTPSAGTARYDDIVINNTTGSVNNSWPGDTKIFGLIPNAPGDSTALSRGGSDSGSNWGQVDETPPNDATDYVFGSSVNSHDLYNIPDLSGFDSVQAATLWLRAQKSDASTANIATMISSGGTEYTGSDQPLTTSWLYYKENYDVDPTDSAAWTISRINALQIGEKVR